MKLEHSSPAPRVEPKTPVNADIARELAAAMPDAAVTVDGHAQHADEDVLRVAPHAIKKVAERLKRDYPYLMDVCGADYPERDSGRFDVVYHFANPDKRSRLRLKTSVDESGSVPSLTSVYRSANWFEREAWDMYGIPFAGHPNLRRILTHEDFVGHPLRKDYPADRQQPCVTPVEHTYQRQREEMLARGDVEAEGRTWINIGPAHPATHGVLRMMSVLNGEIIEQVELEIGYLHRCFEKMCETHNYNQIIPYTDRLNYCSAPLNNNAWCRAIEKMMGITVPARARAIRVILDEFSRVIDHIVCIGAMAVDSGALSNFWYGFQARERVYDLFEKLCGARLTVSLARVGGLGFDLPDGWVEQAKATLKDIRQAHGEINHLLTKNRIFTQRTVGAGALSARDAIDFGVAGPCLRATGVAHDLRAWQPYDGYDQFEWDVVVGHRGDTYDRYIVRMEEILQSCRILEQALANIPAGPIAVEDHRITLPPKEEVYNSIEGLMNHFMLVIHGVQPPPGEIYGASEGANGELGFYVVSDGSGRPHRVKCRPPCFANLQPLPVMVKGQLLSDAIPTMASINYIAGELDR